MSKDEKEKLTKSIAGGSTVYGPGAWGGRYPGPWGPGPWGGPWGPANPLANPNLSNEDKEKLQKSMAPGSTMWGPGPWAGPWGSVAPPPYSNPNWNKMNDQEKDKLLKSSMAPWGGPGPWGVPAP